MKISLLGKGSFGSVLASYLSSRGHDVQIDEVDKSEIIFVCVPSYAVVSALLKEKITNQKIIICSKGFASGEKLLSEALEEKFKNEIFFLYGPTLAEELEKGELSAMVLAGGDGKKELKKQIESETLRIELSDDIIGAQVGAALKNAVTIFVGIVKGAGYGENTQAYIFTKGIQEIQKIGIALGAEPNTFFGLTCLGDLTLHSRNRYLGIELGKGRNLDDIISEMHYFPEGINALRNAKIMAKRLSVDIPFISLLYSIIFENYSMQDAIKEIRKF